MQDTLLPVSCILFLSPTDPIYSSIFILVWIVLQLILSRSFQCLIAFPALFLLFSSLRSIVYNFEPHPLSSQDILLFVVALVAGGLLTPGRWDYLLRMPLIALPFVILQLGEKPWDPNPLIGPNQAAYILGLLLTISFSWLLVSKQPAWQRLVAALLSVFSFLMAWQTGSRASIFSFLIAISLFWVFSNFSVASLFKKSCFIFFVGFTGLIVKQFVSPSATGIPGFDVVSDLGRLSIAQCFVSIPFSGNNRFIYGVGFDQINLFCADPVNGGIAEHAHNIYLQLFAISGVLGIVGLLFLGIAFFRAWNGVDSSLSCFSSRTGKLLATYIIFQGFFDLSMIHWPFSIAVTGIFLSIPLSVVFTRFCSSAVPEVNS